MCPTRSNNHLAIPLASIFRSSSNPLNLILSLFVCLVYTYTNTPIWLILFLKTKRTCLHPLQCGACANDPCSGLAARFGSKRLPRLATRTFATQAAFCRDCKSSRSSNDAGSSGGGSNRSRVDVCRRCFVCGRKALQQCCRKGCNAGACWIRHGRACTVRNNRLHPEHDFVLLSHHPLHHHCRQFHGSRWSSFTSPSLCYCGVNCSGCRSGRCSSRRRWCRAGSTLGCVLDAVHHTCRPDCVDTRVERHRSHQFKRKVLADAQVCADQNLHAAQ